VPLECTIAARSKTGSAYQEAAYKEQILHSGFCLVANILFGLLFFNEQPYIK